MSDNTICPHLFVQDANFANHFYTLCNYGYDDLLMGFTHRNQEKVETETLHQCLPL